MNDRSAQVIKTYNRLAALVLKNQWRIGSLLSFNDKTMAAADKLQRWLDDRDYALGPYLSACFSKHRWGYRPRLEKLHLAQYRNHYEENSLEAQLWWGNLEREKRSSDPMPLHKGREIVKKRLLQIGGPEHCMHHQESGAFNPLSAVCGGCSAGDQCAEVDGG